MTCLALMFAFSSLNRRMSASCFCLETFKLASILLRNCFICALISCIVDVSTWVERAYNLISSLLVATISWSKETISLVP